MGRTGRTRRRKRGEKRSLESLNPESSDLYGIIHKLCTWLGQLNWRNETSLAQKYYSNMGWGLYCKKSIESGNVLIRIPFNGLITLYTMEYDKHFCELFASSLHLFQNNKIHFQGLLSLYILFHKHLKISPFYLYIETIPQTFTSPLFCSKEEFSYLPENILEMTVAQNVSIKESYAAFSDIFKEKVCECCSAKYFPDIITLESFKWAYFAVNSRCVYIEPKIFPILIEKSIFLSILRDRAELALSPLLDFINHSDDANTEARLSHSMDYLRRSHETKDVFYELYTKNKYRKYEQVFISYGNHSNHLLLIHYGFIVKGNRHDIFNFSIHDIEGLIQSNPSIAIKFKTVHRNKFKFIKDHYLDQQMFVSLDDGFSHNLKITIFLTFKCDTHFSNVLDRIAFGASENLEESVNEECKMLIMYKIQEYKTFTKGLEDLSQLTESGRVVVDFMEESICYLEQCLNKFFPK